MVVETVRGVYASAPTYGEAVSQLIVYVVVEIVLFVQLIPDVLLARTESRWLAPLAPVLRGALLGTWPLRAVLNLAISVAHISDEEAPAARESQQQGLEALMEAAQEEGILASNEARLIGQVVEFSDKRVLELMTPRPDIIAISASATIEQMRRLPVGMVLVTDQSYISDILESLVNIRLRMQLEQFDCTRFHESVDYRPNVTGIPVTPAPGVPGTAPTNSRDDQFSANLMQLSVYGVMSLYDAYDDKLAKPAPAKK